MMQLRSVSKKLENEINNSNVKDEIKDLAFRILNFEIETFDKNKKKYTNEYEEMIEITLRGKQNEIRFNRTK